MDLMYLPEGRYQLTLVDDCSRFLAATILEQRTTAAVSGVLPRLLKNLPFPVHCIQTDNGSEFGRDLTSLLQHLGIRHTRIRPRSPHLNGKVERVQRTVQEELWDAMGAGRLGHWERWLQDYVRFYNRHRQHSALGYTTPWSMLYNACPDRPLCLTSPEALHRTVNLPTCFRTLGATTVEFHPLSHYLGEACGAGHRLPHGREVTDVHVRDSTALAAHHMLMGVHIGVIPGRPPGLWQLLD